MTETRLLWCSGDNHYVLPAALHNGWCAECWSKAADKYAAKASFAEHEYYLATGKTLEPVA